MNDPSQDISDKRYFSISEVAKLCDIKPYTLRFWEKEFSSLRPITKKGNRRYYQKKDILLINKISDLLYTQGLTVAGAKKSLLSEPKVKPSISEDNEIISDLEGILKNLTN